MKKTVLLTLFALLSFGLFTVSCVTAQGDWPERSEHHDHWHGGIRDRIGVANRRIEEGMDRGFISRNEARRLNAEFDGILYKVERMKADGRLDEREREKINRDLDRLDRDIDRAQNDDDSRRRHDDYRRR